MIKAWYVDCDLIERRWIAFGPRGWVRSQIAKSAQLAMEFAV